MHAALPAQPPPQQPRGAATACRARQRGSGASEISRQPPQPRLAFGIDLGTTNSAIAVRALPCRLGRAAFQAERSALAQVTEPGQRPRVLANAAGERTIPSVVAYAPAEGADAARVLVGSAARA